MHSYSSLFPLLTISLLNGASVHSNSPHSPYTQLQTLTNDVTSIKETLGKMKSDEVASLISRIDQLEADNKKLETDNKKMKEQLAEFNNVYEQQTKDLLALSSAVKTLQDKGNVLNANADFAAVKNDISRIRASLSATQDKIGQVQDGGVKEVQNFQEQLQKIKFELLGFCQETNRKLQEFSDQMKNNLQKAAHSSFTKHTISSGESLASIARLYKTTPDKILEANHLQDTRGLHVGDAVLVPQETF